MIVLSNPGFSLLFGVILWQEGYPIVELKLVY
jgi:hypothetical protein